ncbi:hypothetical protein JCM3766R1_002898 [Sporobolomyces carnicolor]
MTLFHALSDEGQKPRTAAGLDSTLYPDMKSRDGASTPVCIRDDQVVQHLLPTLGFLPLRPAPDPLELFKLSSLDSNRSAPPPAYSDERSVAATSPWQKLRTGVRAILCCRPPSDGLG